MYRRFTFDYKRHSKKNLLILIFFLSSCDQTKEFLGLTQESPDAFQVASYPELKKPTQNFILPVPTLGQRPQGMQKAHHSALEALNISPYETKTPKKESPHTFLQELPYSQDPKIRAHIAQDYEQERPDKTILEMLADQPQREAVPTIIDPYLEEEKLS